MKKELDLLLKNLYERYYRAVYSFFIRREASPEDANDFAQTTFLRACSGLEGYRGEGEWAWLVAIAGRVWLNHLRSRRTEKRHAETTSLEALPQEPEGAWPNPTRARAPSQPLEEVLRRESTQRLRTAIDRLGPEERLCVRLWLSGFSASEIATATRWTIDAVKSRLKRARKRLRDDLADTFSAACFPEIKGDDDEE